MRAHSLTHLSDHDALTGLVRAITREGEAISDVVAYIDEVDRRRLFAPAGYDSMYAYCVEELGLSEDRASKRIRAARHARDFPQLFEAIADGRLNLSGVLLIASYLTAENADDLISAASRKSNALIREVLAQRFPQSELMPLVMAVPATTTRLNEQQAVRPVQDGTAAPAGASPDELVARPGDPRSHVRPVAQERYAAQLMISRQGKELLEYAHALMRHQIPSGDHSALVEEALRGLVEQQEKRTLGAGSRMRSGRRSSTSARHVPVHVRKAVWERDQGRCTFVSESGHACGSRKRLEWDHIVPVARGGQATVENVRLRCRTHNLLEAERVFGAGFMEEKRQSARRSACEEHVRAGAEETNGQPVAGEASVVAADQARDVLAGLSQLGVRGDRARRAVEHSQSLRDATLEERMKAALRFLSPRVRVTGSSGVSDARMT
jgi:hypothetical protein